MNISLLIITEKVANLLPGGTVAKILPYVLFLIGFVFLIKGGDWFVDGASGIAAKFHIPEILIGATVVSIGTTLPEAMVSAGAAFQGVSGIAYGNAIGSIICNTALISAITLAVRPSKTERKPMIMPLCFFFAAVGVYFVVAYGTKSFSRGVGIALLAMFVVYMILTVIQALKAGKESVGAEDGEKSEASEEKQSSGAKLVVLLLLGAVLIAAGADLLIDNATTIATNLGVPDAVIGITIVALGTSLPELVTAITALSKGHGALSLGNIIGANLFNLVLVSGLAITIKPFALPAEKMIAGINASLLVDLPVMLTVMSVLAIPTVVKGKTSRWQGVFLLGLYAAFLGYQIVFNIFL